MSVEPINPQDHTLRDGKIEPEYFCADNNNTNYLSGTGMALAEAVHQTFERDAAYLYYEDSGMGNSRQSDPDTEIDRLARLIVDGEYRRRKESEDA